MFGPLGWQETVFIFILALLLFGPKKLPELGKTVGKALTEFRRASNELKSTWDREMSSLERESESIKEVTREYDPSTYDYSSYDSSSYYDSETQSYTSYDSTATETSSVGASAIQGAESQPGQAPEGTVATSANGTEPPAAEPVSTSGPVEVASNPAAPEKPAEA